MSPKEAAARFAAFTWYTECRSAPAATVKREAHRFAKESWREFLPVADENWGRLLLRLSKTNPSRRAPSAARTRTRAVATDRPVYARQSRNRIRSSQRIVGDGVQSSKWVGL